MRKFSPVPDNEPTTKSTHVPEDDAGDDGLVVAHSDVAFEHLVHVCDLSRSPTELSVGKRRDGLVRDGLLVDPDRGGDRVLDELLHGRVAERREHLGRLGLIGSDVAGRVGVKGGEDAGGSGGWERVGEATSRRRSVSSGWREQQRESTDESTGGVKGADWLVA